MQPRDWTRLWATSLRDTSCSILISGGVVEKLGAARVRVYRTSIMSHPDRQDLIQNAIAFLTDPKVGQSLVFTLELPSLLLSIPDTNLFHVTTHTISGSEGVDGTGN